LLENEDESVKLIAASISEISLQFNAYLALLKQRKESSTQIRYTIDSSLQLAETTIQKYDKLRAEHEVIYRSTTYKFKLNTYNNNNNNNNNNNTLCFPTL
jgi:hypothetical protein